MSRVGNIQNRPVDQLLAIAKHFFELGFGALFDLAGVVTYCVANPWNSLLFAAYYLALAYAATLVVVNLLETTDMTRQGLAIFRDIYQRVLGP